MKQEWDDAFEEGGNLRTGTAPRRISEYALERETSSTVFFEFNRWALDLEAQNLLEKAADLLRGHPEYCLRIDGHCDERGTVAYNLALGERRAQAAKQFLMSLGIAGNRIAVFSYGEERPDDPRHDPEAWARNRRDELTFIK